MHHKFRQNNHPAAELSLLFCTTTLLLNAFGPTVHKFLAQFLYMTDANWMNSEPSVVPDTLIMCSIRVTLVSSPRHWASVTNTRPPTVETFHPLANFSLVHSRIAKWNCHSAVNVTSFHTLRSQNRISHIMPVLWWSDHNVSSDLKNTACFSTRAILLTFIVVLLQPRIHHIPIPVHWTVDCTSFQLLVGIRQHRDR